MAATRSARVLHLTADADELEGKFIVQAMRATGAVAGIVDGSDNAIAAFGSEGDVYFPEGLFMNGIKRGAGAGELYVYLM